MSSPITTHILDTSTGEPAQGVEVTLERHDGTAFVEVGRGATNDDGRIQTLCEGPAQGGVWRLRFETGAYWQRQGVRGFYPYVEVVFEVDGERGHHHVPLLLNPYGYSTYRGS